MIITKYNCLFFFLLLLIFFLIFLFFFLANRGFSFACVDIGTLNITFPSAQERTLRQQLYWNKAVFVGLGLSCGSCDIARYLQLISRKLLLLLLRITARTKLVQLYDKVKLLLLTLSFLGCSCESATTSSS